MEILLLFTSVIVVIAIIVIVFAGALSRQSALTDNRSEVAKPQYKYARKQFVMTKAENDFYQVLQEAIGSAYLIIPQAHLTLFLDHKTVGQNWRAARQVINRKSVDFLICNRSYYNPLVAIELDDSSHNQEDRKQRDELVDAICKETGMPLVRFRWNYQYEANAVLAELAPYLK